MAWMTGVKEVSTASWPHQTTLSVKPTLGETRQFIHGPMISYRDSILCQGQRTCCACKIHISLALDFVVIFRLNSQRFPLYASVRCVCQPNQLLRLTTITQQLKKKASFKSATKTTFAASSARIPERLLPRARHSIATNHSQSHYKEYARSTRILSVGGNKAAVISCRYRWRNIGFGSNRCIWKIWRPRHSIR